MSDDFGSYFGDSPCDRPSGGPLPVPATIAGRYALGDRLGRGGFGEVFRAVDRITDSEVAVKLFRPGAARARREAVALARREVVALRGLRLPGVVRLLDEGVDRERSFLVMELVAGEPFPGVPMPAPWAAIEGATASLLEVLGRVHEAGGLHLDLKPPNVQVTPAGTVVLLDLGLAHGPALGGAADGLGGTRDYVAPELERDRVASERSDLYSVGVMLWQALTGALPRPGSMDVPGAHAANAPDAVWALARALRAPDPAQRPASAWAALERLLASQSTRTGRPMAWTPPLPPGVDALDQADLRACFHGPERLLHLPTAAAAHLHRRTGGERDRVEAELGRWIRLGLVVPEGARLRVQRRGLELLDSMPDRERTGEGAARPEVRVSLRPAEPADGPEAERAREAAMAESEAIARAAIERAHEHLTQGAFDRMRRVLEQGLLHVRRGAQAQAAGEDMEPALLTLWALMALEQRSPEPLELALYEVERAVHRAPPLDQMAALLRAALHEARGSDLDPDARAQLDSLGRLADTRLELWRHTVRLRLAAREGVAQESAMLDSIERALAWGWDLDEVQARVLSWRGRLCFQQGDFERAARLQELAATHAPMLTARMGSMLNSASAWMEVGAYEKAAALARQVLALAQVQGLVLYEGHAEWLLRAIAYRDGQALVPDRELAGAAVDLEVRYLEALICLNEAAVAWRSAALDLAGELAGRAHRLFEVANMRGGRVLARALCLACGAGLLPPDIESGRAPGQAPTSATPPTVDDMDAMTALAEEMLAQPLLDVDWQVLGMLSRLPGGARWQADARRLAATVPDPGRRRELLSPCEQLAGKASGHAGKPGI